MKIKVILATAAVAAIFACTKQEGPAVEKFMLSASLHDGNVRSALGTPDESGLVEVLWKSGDRISVNGILSDAVGPEDDGKKDVRFSFSGSPSAPYKVLYPGTESSNVITLPATQAYVADSFDPSAGASYGNAALAQGSYSVSLTNFCGLIRISLTGSASLSRIVVNTLGGEKISGDFTLATDSEGFTGAFSGGSSGSLTYNCAVQLSATPTHFYIAVPAQTYSAGVEALVYQADGQYMRLKFWGSGRTLSSSDIVAFEDKAYLAGRVETIGELPSLPQEDLTFDTHITVGSYNIWTSMMRDTYYNARNDSSSEYYSGEGDGYMIDDDPRLWNTAKTYMAKVIVDIGYDVFGLNEVSPTQKNELPGLVSAAGGSGYTWKFFLRSSTNDNAIPPSDGEYEAIVYNSNTFTCGTTGKFWLTDKDYGLQPHQGINTLPVSDGNYRIVAYAFLTHKVTGKTILFVNCHGPLNDTVNNWSGDIIKYRITGQGSSTGSQSSTYPINRNGYPVIFVGDLNAAPSEGLMYSKLKAFWNCAYDEALSSGVLPQSEIENPGTWENWRMQQSMLKSDDKRLDHVFCSSEFNVTGYRTNRFRYKAAYSPAASGYRNFYPSDHVPTIAELSL